MTKLLILSFTIALLPYIGMAQQDIEDSLNKIILQSKNEGEIAKAYNGLAYEYSRKNPVKSRAYIESAIAIGKKK